MGAPAHVSIITLGVRDLRRSVEFYEALGWERSGASEDSVAFFQLASVVLALYGEQDLARDALQPPPPGGSREFRGVTVGINVLSIAAVDRLFADFLAAGATVAKRPQRVEWGGYSGYVADPDGHMWELAFNPYSPEWAAPGSG
jgi:catechol 2,3-dioxygenase-like lactoylglutathione lyase family enzyme